MSKKIIIAIIVLFFLTSSIYYYYYISDSDHQIENKESDSSSLSVIIAVVGDCNGNNIVEYQGANLDPLTSMRSLLEQSDVFIFNLEGVLLSSENLDSAVQYPRQSCFVSPPNFAGYMKVKNNTIACLANNHILDGGEIGIEETGIALDENNIYHLGAGVNISDACQPLLLSVKGVKIGFLAYNLFNESVFSVKNDSSGAASCLKCNVTDIIQSLKEKADVVIVMFHWGNSWTQKVTESQILKADEMFDAGADIVIGHHPHMLQAVKSNKSTLTLFSLGNLVFRPDYTMPSTAHKSMVAFIEIEGKHVRNCYFHPVKLDEYGIPRIPTDIESESILTNLADLSQTYNTKIEINDGVGILQIS